MGTFLGLGREGAGGTFAIPHMGGSFERHAQIEKCKREQNGYILFAPWATRSFLRDDRGVRERGAEPKCLS